MSGSDSGESSGNQTTFEQQEEEQQELQNEAILKEHYLRDELPKKSPIHIPANSDYVEQNKTGYQQVKYKWTRGRYKYLSRWHSRTPNAPLSQGDSWVVERHLPGIGNGPNAHPSRREILIRTGSGSRWIPRSTWNKAIHARKNGTATKEQKELLDNGHWKSKK